MTSTLPQTTNIQIRSFQNRDLEEIDRLIAGAEVEESVSTPNWARQFQYIRRWWGVLKFLSLFPNPLQYAFRAYVAEQENQIQGVIQVSPFNKTRSTWRVDHVAVSPTESGEQPQLADIGSQLLRYCFQTIWEARTWLIEVNVNDKQTLALYRQTGFQPLAEMTYWTIAPDLLKTLAEREPDLPNLLPVGNADACLLHQLDTVSMPPLVRQVFDRHVLDFKGGLLTSVVEGMQHRMDHIEVVSAYIFEPQRKAAIGYFKLTLSRTGDRPHSAELTVHPAYTWLYPELLAQMARVAQTYPAQSLQLVSTDYQPEREEYLERIGAERTEHTLLMSRSVWHKLRETRLAALEGLQLSEVLQSFQPARKPVPGRFSLLESIRQLPQIPNQSDLSRLAAQDNSAPLPPDNKSNGSKNNASRPEEPHC